MFADSAASGLRFDRERVLEFLDWSSGRAAPRAVIDALCRWIQELERELRQDARQRWVLGG